MTPWIRKWLRIELRSRADDVSESAKARIHDAAFFLARGCALGELTGHDGGSVTVLHGAARQLWLGELSVPCVDGNQLETFSPRDDVPPLEMLIEREAPTLTYYHALRIGRYFETQLLGYANGAALRDLWRLVLPLGPLGDGDPNATDSARRTSRAIAGRYVDGRALRTHVLGGGTATELYELAIQEKPEPPSGDHMIRSSTAIDAGISAIFDAAAQDTMDWFEDLFEKPLPDSRAWTDECLEYQASVKVCDATESVTLAAGDYRSGRLDWHAFDAQSREIHTGDAVNESIWAVPNAVRFSGQAEDRFWQMESRDINWGGMPIDQRDVPRLVLAAHVLVHGNDWFWIPLGGVPGALSVDTVEVFDSFGNQSTVDPASLDPEWRLFDADVLAGETRSLLMLPPTALLAREGPPLEELHFVRDPRQAWAIEARVEGEFGAGVSGHDLALQWRNRHLAPYLEALTTAVERWQAAMERVRDPEVGHLDGVQAAAAHALEAVTDARADVIRVGGSLEDIDVPLPPRDDNEPTLPKYLFRGDIPANQIPLVPILPEPVTATDRLQFQRYALPDPFSPPNGPIERIRAKGRIMAPEKRPFCINEEEIPAESLRIDRAIQFARGPTGRRYLWIGRKRRALVTPSFVPDRHDEIVDP